MRSCSLASSFPHNLKALQILSNRLIYGNLIPNGSRVSRVGGYDFVSTPMLQAGVRNQVFFAPQTFYPLIIGRPILKRLYYFLKPLGIHSIWFARDFVFDFTTGNLLFLPKFEYSCLLDVSYFLGFSYQ